MGLFSGAKAQIAGTKANRAHVLGNDFASKGQCAEGRKKYQEALKLYEEAIREGDPRPSVHLGQALLFMRLGRWDEAAAIMEAMPKMKNMTEDDWFSLRLNYSMVLWKRGQLDDAIATIGRAGKIKMNSSIYTSLGMYLIDKARETGDYEPVKALNREAMDYDSEDPATLDNIGAMYEGMMEVARAKGNAAEAADCRVKAKKFYALAHEKKPRQITTLYALAKLYHEDGEADKARKILSDAPNLFFSAICPITEDMMKALIREIG